MAASSQHDRILESLRQLKTTEAQEQLVIGIDFGTTFSGIAFAFFTNYKQHPDIVVIVDWPGLEGYPQQKVPTLISYDEVDTDVFRWAAQKHLHEPIVGLKLLLDTEQRQPHYASRANRRVAMSGLPKLPVEMTTDYIKALFDHAMSKITSRYPAQYVDRIPRKFVLSVPAVWSDKAKALTTQAARAAGIYPVDLITEPEAAALYTLHSMKDFSLQTGDAFCVLDAGGGTVDSISYQIKKLAPRLELTELVEPAGNLAGSLNLNKQFEGAIRNMIGDDEFASLKKKVGWEEGMKTFDRHIKTGFRGEEGEVHLATFPMAHLPDNPDTGLEDSCWVMTKEDLEDIFLPVVDDILRLLEDQVTKIRMKRMDQGIPKKDWVRAIFLVGGFGSSEYLRQQIKAKFPDIEIIQPVDAWSAIMKGAVLSALPNEAVVKASIAKKHYGISVGRRADPIKDVTQDFYWSDYEGCNMVRAMSWYIQKGDELQRDHKISFPFYRTLRKDFQHEELRFTTDLMMSDASEAPTYPSTYGTRQYVTMTSDLRCLNRSNLDRRIGADGRVYWLVHFNIILMTISAGFKFSLEFEGREMGSVEAKFN